MFSIQCEISEKDSQNHMCFLVGHGVEHLIAPWMLGTGCVNCPVGVLFGFLCMVFKRF